MNRNTRARRRASWTWVVALAAALALVPLASAQQLTGNIYGYVADEQGGRLPGVTVTLTGRRRREDPDDGCARPVPVPQPLAGVLPSSTSCRASRPSTIRTSVSVGRNTAVERGRRSRGRDHGHRRRASPLLDTRNRDRHHRQPDRARRDPDGARPLGGSAVDPRRAHRPHQRRRQRVRPAVAVRRPRLRQRPGGLVARRRGDHRHVGHGLLAGLLRLRLVRRDAGHDRRHRRLDRHRRRAAQHGHQARHQRVRGSARFYLADQDLQSNNVTPEELPRASSTAATASTRSRTTASKWADPS